jgi:hypothetical protein
MLSDQCGMVGGGARREMTRDVSGSTRGGLSNKSSNSVTEKSSDPASLSSCDHKSKLTTDP